MRTRTALPAVGAGLLLVAGGGDELAFRPAQGTSLTKTFTAEGEFTLDELGMIVNGQDVGEMIGRIEMTMTQDTRIAVTDSFRAVADGRPTELHRTFDELTGNVRFEMSPAQMEMPEVATASELEGKTVVFRWNDEEQEYERSFEDAGGDAELLEGLDEDMDLRVFLPSGEVSVGDTWNVELADLACLAAPGGNLRLLPEDMEVDAEDAAMFEELFASFGQDLGDLLEGECVCTYKGTREEDGETYGEIEIQLEIATTVDLSSMLSELIQKAIAEQGAADQVQLSLDAADLDVDYEGSGTLLWSTAGGHLGSFEMQGDVVMGFDLSMSVQAQGESQDLEASLEMSGTMRQTAETK